MDITAPLRGTTQGVDDFRMRLVAPAPFVSRTISKDKGTGISNALTTCTRLGSCGYSGSSTYNQYCVSSNPSQCPINNMEVPDTEEIFTSNQGGLLPASFAVEKDKPVILNQSTGTDDRSSVPYEN